MARKPSSEESAGRARVDLPPLKRRKLAGREFYESLGSPRMILAPMVDQSEFVWIFVLPYRLDLTDIAIGMAYAHSIIHEA